MVSYLNNFLHGGCFNPRSPRGGATMPHLALRGAVPVSIHAPHEGERRPLLLYIWGDTRVSIHAPHEGERH